MYLTCIKKELLHNILSLRYALVFFLFLILTLSATMIRTSLYKKQAADYFADQPNHQKTLTLLRSHWESLSMGKTVEKPPNPLSIFCAGLENEMTRSFNLVTDGTEPRLGPRKLSSPSFQYSLNLDMVLIINLVCSLLAMLLMYDAISGEKEQGTLKVILAGPIPRDVIIMGKLVAGLITVLIPLLLSWIISLVYVLVIAGVGFGAVVFERLGWLVALSILFISLYFALGIAVSAWTHRSATSLVVCLFLWIGLALAIPNLVPMTIKHFAPVPPQSKLELEKETITNDITQTKWPGWREELVATGKFTNANDGQLLWDELGMRTRIEQARLYGKIERFYNKLVFRQLGLNQQISRISPSASYVFASTELAGTGVHDYMRLMSDVEAYQRAFNDAQADQEKQRIAKQKLLPPDKQVDEPYNPELWPVFTPSNASLSSALNVCWIDLALLAMVTIILFMVAFVGFIRYNPC